MILQIKKTSAYIYGKEKQIIDSIDFTKIPQELYEQYFMTFMKTNFPNLTDIEITDIEVERGKITLKSTHKGIGKYEMYVPSYEDVSEEDFEWYKVPAHYEASYVRDSSRFIMDTNCFNKTYMVGSNIYGVTPSIKLNDNFVEFFKNNYPKTKSELERDYNLSLLSNNASLIAKTILQTADKNTVADIIKELQKSISQNTDTTDNADTTDTINK